MSIKNSEQKQLNKKKASVEAPLYSREEIMANPTAFGVRPEVLAGALSLMDDEMLTRSQVVDAIEKFKKRKV